MSLFSEIPHQYQSPFTRAELLIWLRNMPLRFHDRLSVYFSWLDHFGQPYTAEEIDSLKTPKEEIGNITSE